MKNKELINCLSELENAIDSDVEDQLIKEWLDFTFDRFDGDLFSPSRSKKAIIQNIPKIYINDTLGDNEQGYVNMALSQFAGCLSQLASGNGTVLSVRCNYGVGIMPSLFGCNIFYMNKEINTLPTSMPLTGDNVISSVIDKGIPDLNNGFGVRVFRMAQLYKEIALTYPKIGKYVFVYHPDMQGPMDIAELVWGSDIFYGLLDEPERAHQLLNLIVDTYIRFYREWDSFFPSNGQYSCHWGVIHKGTIMLRNDSAMNLSPSMFEEFIKPYDQKLLFELKGGAMHFCGKGDHYIDSYCKMQGIHAINMSQPKYNNMETIFSSTVDNGIKLLLLNRSTANDALLSGRNLKSCVSV